MLVSHRSKKDMDGSWPTWIPKYDQKYDPSQDATFDYPLYAADESFDSSMPIINFTGSEDLLARGQVEGYITAVSQVLTSEVIDSVDGVRHMLNEFDGLCLPFGGAEMRLRKRHALAVALFSNEQDLREEEAVRFHRAFIDYIAQTDALPPRIEDLTLSSSKLERDASSFRQGMILMGRNRRIFVTNTDMVGLGPCLTKANDVVAVLYGSKAPFVLRPLATPEKDEDENVWVCQLVGHCCMEGIMYGEAVKRHQAEQKDGVVFEVR